MAIQNIGGYNTNLIVENFIEAGEGIDVTGGAISLATPQYPFQYFGAKSLNFSFQSGLSTIQLQDGTSIQGITMDYDTGSQISIETVALNSLIPRVTIFWLATATSSSDTVFATNSGWRTATPRTSPFMWSPNNRVATMYLDNQKNLYIGGFFTTLSSSAGQHRFAVIDLSAGQSAGVFGTTGRPLTAVTLDIGVQLSSVNFVGGAYTDLSARANLTPVSPPATLQMKWHLQFPDGTVEDIQKFNDFLVFGGTFTSVNAVAYDTGLNKMISVKIPSRGLMMISLSSDIGAESYRPRFHAFDLNHNVYKIEKNDDETSLYVGGYFTNRKIKITTVEQLVFRNNVYTYTSTTNSQYDTIPSTNPACKGLIKIDYDPSISIPVKDRFTIDYTFNNNAALNILKIDTVNSIGIFALKYVNGIIYAGGSHSAFETSYGKHVTAHIAETVSDSRGRMYDYGNAESKKWGKYSFNKTIYVLQYDPSSQVFCVGGEFTNFTDLKTAQLYNLSYLAAFKIDNITSPNVFTNWNPLLNGYVSDIQTDSEALYIIGAFSKVGGSTTRLRCAALSKPSNIGSAAALNWRADLGGGSANWRDTLLLIPNNNPLSGVLIGGYFNSVNSVNRVSLARVVKYNQEMVPFDPKTVIWELYGKIVNNQTNINIDTDTAIVTSLTATAYPTHILNTTSFPITSTTEKTFEGIQAGLPLRIVVKRKTNDGTYHGRAWIVGARIDYDTKAAYELYKDSLNVPVGITKQPVTLSAAIGQTATLSAVLSGSEPIDYNWYLNGAPLFEVDSNVYSIVSVTTADEGVYYLEASNVKNSVTSDEAILYVNPVGFTTLPVGSSLVYGTSAVLISETSGFNVAYKWYQSGTLVTGASTSNYTFASAVDSDAGAYTVVATNFFRSVTSTPVLITINNLQITVDLPSTKTVPIGGTTSLTLEYVGRPPLTVQWLSGTTAGTITTPIVGPNNLGQGYYKATVTNGVSSQVTSNVCYIYQI